MNWGILAAVLAYEMVVIVGIGLYLSRQIKAGKEGAFLLSSRDLPTAVVGVTLALTVLGTPHIFGLLERAWFDGASAIWFGLAHVVLLAVVCTTTGKWARRLQVTTIPEMASLIFGGAVPRLMVCSVIAGMTWGILTLETQGLGIVFATLTGISIQQGAVIGGVLGVLYVILAGMKEIAWVNLINAVIMYLGLIVAMVFVTLSLSGGWQAVGEYYISQDQAYMLSIWGTPEILLTYGLSIVLATVFSQGINQQLLQPAMSAKSEHTVRNALWIAAPVNGFFGVFMICIGLAAKANPESNPLGPKLAGTTMLLESLPPWLVAWIFATLLAAVLSSFAMASMACATMFTIDIYKNFYNPDADERMERRVTRIAVVVLALSAGVAAAYLPPIVKAMNWLFAWLTPVFWMVIFGLFWKRSAKAAVWTFSVTWLLNMIWSFTSIPALLGVEGLPNVYITLASSFIVGITSLKLTDSKPGLFKQGQAVPART